MTPVVLFENPDSKAARKAARKAEKKRLQIL
jgi:hypothetical protein